MPSPSFITDFWKTIKLGPTSTPFLFPLHPTVDLVPCTCPMFSSLSGWLIQHWGHGQLPIATGVPVLHLLSFPVQKPSERSQFPCGPSINVSACPTRPVSTESRILPFPDSPQARQGICLVCFKEAPGFPPTQVNSEKLV